MFFRKKETDPAEAARINAEKIQEQKHRELAEQALRILQARDWDDAKTRESRRRELVGRIFGGFNQTATAGDSAADGIAMDAIIKDLTEVNRYQLDNLVLDRLGEDSYFIGYATCAALKQIWIIDRACTIPAEDAIAGGFDLELSADVADADGDGSVSAEEQRKNERLLNRFSQAAKDYGISDVCVAAEVAKKTFGYCLVLPMFRSGLDVDMSVPFNLDGIKANDYVGLSVIEPLRITPQITGRALIPGLPGYNEPEYYNVYGRKIHRSWVIKLVNAPVPDILKPVYQYGGIPLPQQMWKRVYAAGRVADESLNLAMTKRTKCVAGNLEAAIQQPELTAKRVQTIADLANNHGVLLYDSSMNPPSQLDTNLSDFDSLVMSQYQLVSAIAQMPVTKLLKVQLKGFDSAGTYEMQDYNQSLKTIQANDYTRIIDFHNQLFAASVIGSRIPVQVRWRELDIPTKSEQATIDSTKASTAATLVAAGVVTADEVRTILRNTSGDYTTLATTNSELDEDAAELNDEIRKIARGGDDDNAEN